MIERFPRWLFCIAEGIIWSTSEKGMALIFMCSWGFLPSMHNTDSRSMNLATYIPTHIVFFLWWTLPIKFKDKLALQKQRSLEAQSSTGQLVLKLWCSGSYAGCDMSVNVTDKCFSWIHSLPAAMQASSSFLYLCFHCSYLSASQNLWFIFLFFNCIARRT